MNFAFLVFLLGVIYGYFKPGREDRLEMIKKAAFIGFFIGLLFGALSFFFVGFFAIPIMFGASAGLAIILVVYTIFFVVGTVIGDVLEGLVRR